mgnify:CR=1 FL=1
MSVTVIDASLVKKLWGKQVWGEVQEALFWKSFITREEPEKMDKDTGAGVIVRKDDLKKEKGDTITLQLVSKLTGSGKTGDNTLEGFEEEMNFWPFSVTVDQVRHAVRIKGRMEEQKAAFDMRAAAKMALKTWLVEKIDKGIFAALCSSPSANRVLFGGVATEIGQIAASSKLTAALIGKAKRKAMLATPKFRPLVIKGKPYYLMVVHPYAMRDLRTDSSILNALHDAWWRGSDNPIFTGAEIVYDGVVIYEHPWVKKTTEGAASANALYNLFLGGHAGVWGVASEPNWEEDDFDYKNSHGFSIGQIQGVAKAVFNDEDHATLAVITGGADD